MHNQVGLTAREVRDRTSRGLTNSFRPATSRSLLQIVRANVFTRFNLLLGALFVVVIVMQSPVDGLFGLVFVVNSAAGIVQEVRVKRHLDSLAFLHASTSRVVRDGTEATVRTDSIVLGDLVLLTAGDQVPADGTVIESCNLETNESNLTGESGAVSKPRGSEIFSGTFVTAGNGAFETTSVGASSCVHRLTTQAKTYQRVQSEIQRSLETLLVWIGWAVLVAVPLQVVAIARSADGRSTRSGILRGVAGLVGVVPEGLVLLSTLAFLNGAMILSRRRILVQELPAVEGLARVNVVCIDKTGTLTTGIIDFERCEYLATGVESDVNEALSALAHDADANSTLQAVARAVPAPSTWSPVERVPFDSARKWKALRFEDHANWFLGAPEVLMPDDDAVRRRVQSLAETGRRVLLLCRTTDWHAQHELPGGLEATALVVLHERIRPHTRATLDYFVEQGVRVIVMSGDNPHTVSAIAREVGVSFNAAIDARSLANDPMAVRDAVTRFSVFGRVSPEQKRLMVRALQENGDVVAMTGDGVNDVLALKRADIGIAMGNAAPATKATAQFVLLDSNFDSLPVILAEGRRVIANVEKVAELFLAKNAMSFLAIVIGAVAGTTFPVLPRQMTLISALTIGIPAFFFALGPNTRRFTPGFLPRIVRRSVPLGTCIGLSVVAADIFGNEQTGTTATLAALLCFLVVLVQVSRPVAAWKLGLIASLAATAFVCFSASPARDFFGFAPSVRTASVAILCSLPAMVVISVAHSPDDDRKR